MHTQPKKHRGAPLGNQNHFKHGFYSRRLKKRALTGIESAGSAGLLKEIALIRDLIRQCVESFNPNSGFTEHADLLRNICLASLVINRVIKEQSFLTSTGSAMDDEISAAIRQVNAEFRANLIQSIRRLPVAGSLSNPSNASRLPSTPDEA